MAYAPRITTFICKKLRTSHVEDLPTIEPHRRLFFPVCLFQKRPDLLPARVHLREPVLTGLGVVLTGYPPLLLEGEVVLEEMQEVCRWHCSTREEVRAHPPLFEVVGRLLMCEDVNEKLAFGFERPCDLGHEELVVLHMLEELDRDHPIECPRLELISDHVSGDDIQIGESPLGCFSFDISALRP